MRRASTKRFIYYQFFVLVFLITFSFLNEGVDLPHILFNDPPTLPIQRVGEIIIEVCIACIAVSFEVVLIQKMRRDIRILEGFIPICANCKKIREVDQWQSMERYITSHSMAEFTHSICPDCLRVLYPETAERILSSSRKE